MIHGGAEEFVARWVIDRLGDPDIVIPPDFGHYKAFAVTIRDRLVAGVVYHGWSPANRNIMVTIAAESPRCATRSHIGMLLRIPFEAFDCKRITAAIREDNQRSRKLAEGLGFQLDCILRGTKLTLYGLTAQDYSSLRERFRIPPRSTPRHFTTQHATPPHDTTQHNIVAVQPQG